MAVEIVKWKNEEVARPATKDGEDGELSIRYQDVTRVLTVLEAPQHATTIETDNTPQSMRILQYKCNHSHAMCMTGFEGAKKSVQT